MSRREKNCNDKDIKDYNYYLKEKNKTIFFLCSYKDEDTKTYLNALNLSNERTFTTIYFLLGNFQCGVVVRALGSSK